MRILIVNPIVMTSPPIFGSQGSANFDYSPYCNDRIPPIFGSQGSANFDCSPYSNDRTPPPYLWELGQCEL